MNREEIMERIKGWDAYAIHGDTYNLRKRMVKRLRKLMRNVLLPLIL